MHAGMKYNIVRQILNFALCLAKLLIWNEYYNVLYIITIEYSHTHKSINIISLPCLFLFILNIKGHSALFKLRLFEM